MSELKTIVFARGQNESIDPRVLPDDQHKIVKNVRFRKDGRPQKRGGLTSQSLSGMTTGAYVNFVADLSGARLMGAGGKVSCYSPSLGTWVNQTFGSALPTWVPGRRRALYRDESVAKPIHCSVAITSGGVVATAWSASNGTLYSKTLSTTGAANAPLPKALTAATYPRLLTANGNTYLFSIKTAGALLEVRTYDPVTDTFGSATTLQTIVGGGGFDVCVQGTGFVLIWQSSLVQLSIARYTASSTPVINGGAVTQATNSSVQWPSICCTSTSSIFFAWLETTATPSVRFGVYDSTLTTLTGALTTLATTAGLFDQPGIAVTADAAASIFYGKYVSPTSFFLSSTVSNTSVVSTNTTQPNMRMGSKPFIGPAPSGGSGGGNGTIYIWVHTPELSAWEDQRTLTLVNYSVGNSRHAMRHLHIPGLYPSEVVTAGAPTGNLHLFDVVDSGAGFWAATLSQLRAITDTTSTQNFGIDLFDFHSFSESQFFAARDTAMANKALQVSGGALAEYCGSVLEETGFSMQPVIVAATGIAGGAQTVGNYLYRAVFEFIDSAGRRARSATSDPFALAIAGANLTGQLTLSALPIFMRASSTTVTIHVYRSLVGQSTYHRVTPNVNAPQTSPSDAANITWSDGISDTIAAQQEFIYTDGGVLDHTLPPPCHFMTLCNARLWLGGQFDRTTITASKLLKDGEPTQFSAFAPFSVILPRDCTGLASIDGTVVAFAADAIYLVTGDGPNEQGVGTFNPPSALPTNGGCIDWRSIVETDLGVFFQSNRGIMLLPRGFGAPVFIGAPIEDTLRTYPLVMSATLVDPSNGDETSIRFALSDGTGLSPGAVAIYWPRTQGWTVDTVQVASAVVGPGGAWLGRWVQTVSSSSQVLASLYEEPATATYADGAVFIPSILATGDVRPFGVAGYGNFNEVTVMGEYRGNANVIVSVSVDGVAADSYTFAVTSADAADGVVYLGVTPKIRKGCSIAITVQDAAIGGTATEGFIAQAVFLEVEAMPNGKRLAAARRA